VAQLKREPLTIETKAGPLTFDIEIADTLEQKSIGLMFRRSLAENSGMLFPYTPAQELTMWMRNTLIPLDMLFIRADGLIHRIEAWTEPLSERVIASQGPVTAVLELGGGVAEKLGIKTGDRVSHPHFQPLDKKKP
jgi:uncharacterized membrane protein (UPF0127 family)